MPVRSTDSGKTHTATTPLSPTHLVAGTVLPPSLHLTGKIKIVWGTIFPSKCVVPTLSFALRRTFIIPKGTQLNDYVLPSEKEVKRKYEIRFNLHHSSWDDDMQLQPPLEGPEEGHKDTEKAKDQIKDKVEEERRWVDKCLKDGKELTIYLDRLKVMKVTEGDTVCQVELQGSGERCVRYDGSSIRKLLTVDNAPKSAGPPSWFDGSSLTSLPSTSAPRSPDRPGQTNNVESSRLRPLSSHVPPDLSRIPSRTSSTSTSSGINQNQNQNQTQNQQQSSRGAQLKRPPSPALRLVSDRPVTKKSRVPETRLEDRLREITPLNGPPSSKQAAGQPAPISAPAPTLPPATEQAAAATNVSAPSPSPIRAPSVLPPLLPLPGHGSDTAVSRPKEPEKRNIVQLGPPGWQNLLSPLKPPVKASAPISHTIRPPLQQGSSTELSGTEIDEPPYSPRQTSAPLRAPAESSTLPPPPAKDRDPTPIEINNAPSESSMKRHSIDDGIYPKAPRRDETPARPSSVFSDRSSAKRLGQADSTPVFASRRSSLQPNASQSSPAVGARRVSMEDSRTIQRKEAEAALRAQRLGQQAESSRAAQMMKSAFFANGIEYSPLNDVRPQTVVNVIAVVVDRKELQRRADYFMSIVIADPSRYSGGDSSIEELVVTLFRAASTDVPTDVERGDVMLFRGMKITEWKDKTKGQCFNPTGSFAGNTWAIMKGGREIKFANKEHMDPPLTKPEVERMKQIYRWWNDENGGGPSTPFRAGGGGTPSSSARRTASGIPRDMIALGQVKHGDFFDPTFKIMYVHFKSLITGPALELYVTDGTRSTMGVPNKNFHGVRFPHIPPDALFCLAIIDDPPENERHIFQFGNIVRLMNVRAKLYRGELELAWSEKMTSDQLAMGWRARKSCHLVDSADAKAKNIERRLAALKRGDEADETGAELYEPHDVTNGPEVGRARSQNSSSMDVFSTSTPRPQPAQAGPSGPSGQSNHSAPTHYRESDQVSQRAQNVQHAPPRLATHISTKYTDPIEHPLSTISEILESPTLPNRYRLIARVKSLHPRGLPGNDSFVQPYCTHCKSAFKGYQCMSCNDEHGAKAEYRYRFVLIVEDVNEDGEARDQMAVLVADGEAAELLPALPPYSSSSNPNEIKRTTVRFQSINGVVYDILQGAKFDGARPKPLIDMSVQVYEVDRPKGFIGAGARAETGSAIGHGDGKIAVVRMFGMKLVS